MIWVTIVAASLVSQSTAASADEARSNVPRLTAPKELLSPWRLTKTNEWVRYHYPVVRPTVYIAGELIQPLVTLEGWYETNHSPPVVEAKIVSARPPVPPPNLDDPKSLREYAIRNGLFAPEIVVRPDPCSGGG